MATPPMPVQQAAPPTAPPPDATQGLMGQAQQALNNPVGQPAPNLSGGAGPLIAHPMVQKIIQALASASQAYGWTGSSPQERLERTQLQGQKAETLARLAQTGQYQQGELAYRQRIADVGQQNADTRSKGEADTKAYRDAQTAINNSKLQLATDANEWKKATAEGRLDVAQTKLDQSASALEETIKQHARVYGIDQAKLELGEQANQIKQGMLGVMQTALSQKGTKEGMDALQKLKDVQLEHPILSQFFGLGDVSDMVSKATSAGIPGTSPTSPGAAPQPQAGPSSQPTPPANKVQAMRNKKTPAGQGGVTHVWTPNGIQPVGGTQQP